MRAFAILLTLTAVAHADDPGDADIHAGQELATQGRFKDAIVQFKAAHAAAPTRSEPDCLIALAYRRLERWGQARLFLTRCLTFPTHPPWFAQLVTDIDEGLAHAGFTQVNIAVHPDGAPAVISISSFAPDETFTAQPIFVEPGKALVSVTAAGYETVQLAIDVPAKGPYDVPIELAPHAAAQPPPPPPQPEPQRRPQPQPRPPVEHEAAPVVTGKRVLIGAGVVVGVGVVAHVLAASTRSDLETNARLYDQEVDTFKTEREIAIGAYAVGAVGVAVGVWLLHRETPVTPTVTGHAAGVAWSGSW